MLAPIEMPSDHESEDLFLPLGPINISLRQVFAMGAAVIAWLIISSLVGGLFNSTAFGMLITGWIPLIGFAIAFVKIRGRWFEDWLRDWCYFMIVPKVFTLSEEDEAADERSLADDVDWDDFDFGDSLSVDSPYLQQSPMHNR